MLTAPQYKPLPNATERSLAGLLAKNSSLLKFSITINEQSSRNAVDKAIDRNRENGT